MNIKKDTSWFKNANCEECKTEFRAKRRSKNGPPAKFCSKKCLITFRNRPVEQICISCKKNYALPLWKTKLKGKPTRKFCSHECKQSFWESSGKSDKRGIVGKRHFSSSGYVYVYQPDHPSVKGKAYKYVLEHRLVMESKLERYLEKGENVHHLNCVKSDNRPENLELWASSQPTGQRVSDLLKKINALEAEIKFLKGE
jgi:YHS domain-containing protein